jgi:hypothetical protein
LFLRKNDKRKEYKGGTHINGKIIDRPRFEKKTIPPAHINTKRGLTDNLSY